MLDEFQTRWLENPTAALAWIGQQKRGHTMSLFNVISKIVHDRKIAIRLFGRDFQIGFTAERHESIVQHILWNIVHFSLAGGVDQYSVSVDGFVAFVGFTVNVDLSFSRIGTGGLNVAVATPLFESTLTVGAYLPEPEKQPVRGLLAGPTAKPNA